MCICAGLDLLAVVHSERGLDERGQAVQAAHVKVIGCLASSVLTYPFDLAVSHSLFSTLLISFPPFSSPRILSQFFLFGCDPVSLRRQSGQLDGKQDLALVLSGESYEQSLERTRRFGMYASVYSQVRVDLINTVFVLFVFCIIVMSRDKGYATIALTRVYMNIL